jgi:hypothetical protein
MTVSPAGLDAARAIPVLGNPEQPGLRNRLAALLTLPEPANRQPAERFVDIGELTPRGGCPPHQLTQLLAGGTTPRIPPQLLAGGTTPRIPPQLLAGGTTPRIPPQRSGRGVRLRRLLGVVEGQG